MQLLSQTVRKESKSHPTIPTVFRALEANGFNLLRGNIVLVASGPGTGKTLLALTITIRSRASSLYFSADSDEFTMASRAAAIVNRSSISEASQGILDKNPEVLGSLTSLPLQVAFDPAPDVDYIEMQVEAYREVYGEYPELIVIDNFVNVSFEAESTFTDMSSLMGFFHSMARTTGACVLILTHVTGSYNNADHPIPLSGVKGQITDKPAQVLTLHRKGSDGLTSFIGASIVKNRSGKADPSGHMTVDFPFDGARAHLGGYV